MSVILDASARGLKSWTPTESAQRHLDLRQYRIATLPPALLHMPTLDKLDLR